MKKRLTSAALALGLLLAPLALAIQQFSESGTATAVATTVSIGFYPTSIIVFNRDATNELWLRLDATTATAAAPALEIKAGENRSVSCLAPHTGANVCRNALTIICSAAETALYQVDAVR